MRIASACPILGVMFVLLTCCAPTGAPVPAKPIAGSAAAPQSGELSSNYQSSESLTVLSLRALETLDGGDLEDAYRQLGVQFAAEPGEFLGAIQNAGLQSEKIPDLFVMLPLDFVDRPCEGARELNRRQSLLRSVEGFDEIKSIADPAITNSIKRKIKQCNAEF